MANENQLDPMTAFLLGSPGGPPPVGAMMPGAMMSQGALQPPGLSQPNLPPPGAINYPTIPSGGFQSSQSSQQRPGIRMLLGNFLADLGAGMAAGSQARPGAELAGGMGGALMAPQERAFRESQMEFYRSKGQAALGTAASKQVGAYAQFLKAQGYNQDIANKADLYHQTALLRGKEASFTQLRADLLPQQVEISKQLADAKTITAEALADKVPSEIKLNNAQAYWYGIEAKFKNATQPFVLGLMEAQKNATTSRSAFEYATAITDVLKTADNLERLANMSHKDLMEQGAKLADEVAPALEKYFGTALRKPSAALPPPGATHTGIGSVDGKKHWLDDQNNDKGLAE